MFYFASPRFKIQKKENIPMTENDDERLYQKQCGTQYG